MFSNQYTYDEYIDPTFRKPYITPVEDDLYQSQSYQVNQISVSSPEIYQTEQVTYNQSNNLNEYNNIIGQTNQVYTGGEANTYDVTNMVRSLYSELTDEINKNEENAFFLINDKYDDETQERMMKKYSYVKEKYLNKIVIDSDGKIEYVDIFDHEVYYIKGMKLLITYLYENLITFIITGRINAFLTLKNAINKVNTSEKNK